MQGLLEVTNEPPPVGPFAVWPAAPSVDLPPVASVGGVEPCPPVAVLPLALPVVVSVVPPPTPTEPLPALPGRESTELAVAPPRWFEAPPRGLPLPEPSLELQARSVWIRRQAAERKAVAGVSWRGDNIGRGA